MKARYRLAAVMIAGGTGLAGALPAAGQELAIPEPIAAGHEELYARMEAATAVMKALGPHFQKEEEYALPQLGLLPGLVGAPLAEGASLTPEQRKELIARTEQLRTELPQMLEEHQAIAAALEDLRKAAEQAGEPAYARLAEEIGVHAKTEEEVLYPTALLIGDYARLQGEAQQQ